MHLCHVALLPPQPSLLIDFESPEWNHIPGTIYRRMSQPEDRPYSHTMHYAAWNGSITSFAPMMVRGPLHGCVMMTA